METHKNIAFNKFYVFSIFIYLFAAVAIPEQIKFLSIPGIGGLTISRILLAFVIVQFTLIFLLHYQHSKISNDLRTFIAVSILFSVLGFIGVLINNASIKWILYFVECFIITLIIFSSIYSPKYKKQFYKVIIYILAFCNFAFVFEYVYGAPFYAGFIVYSDEVITTILDGQYRFLSKRSQSVFQNPYSASIHALILITLCSHAYNTFNFNRNFKNFILLNILIGSALVFFSNVRVSTFLLSLFFLYILLGKIKNNFLLLFLVFPLIIFLDIPSIFTSIYDLFYSSRSHFSSTQERLLQLEFFTNSFNQANAMFGIGLGEATEFFSENGFSALDNMYLSLILESGLLGFFFASLLLFIPFYLIVKYRRLYHLRYIFLSYIFLLILFTFNASKEVVMIWSILILIIFNEIDEFKSDIKINS